MNTNNLSLVSMKEQLNSQYNAIKFKYLCLKLEKQLKNQTNNIFKQTGGYTETTQTHLAAAAIAVINCTYFGTQQKSVDCSAPVVNTTERINQINAELVRLENLSGIANINKKRELNVELNSLKSVKSSVDSVSVNNRTCDNVLATVASIYLSIIASDNVNTFTKLINDLINGKLVNCTNDQKTEAKKLEIIEYFLNAVNKMNEYLENIGKNVSYEAIFTNAEYGKQDRTVAEKLIEKGLNPIIVNDENFRMVNQFIGPRLDKVKFINLHNLIDNIKASSDDNKNILKRKFPQTPQKTSININNFIIFGVYTYDANRNKKTIITNPITYVAGKKYL
jgi:hypothetical protein